MQAGFLKMTVYNSWERGWQKLNKEQKVQVCDAGDDD
jgi:uncharacterized membrane protein